MIRLVIVNTAHMLMSKSGNRSSSLHCRNQVTAGVSLQQCLKPGRDLNRADSRKEKVCPLCTDVRIALVHSKEFRQSQRNPHASSPIETAQSFVVNLAIPLLCRALWPSRVAAGTCRHIGELSPMHVLFIMERAEMLRTSTCEALDVQSHIIQLSMSSKYAGSVISSVGRLCRLRERRTRSRT